jgi:hypothetical protein
VAVLAAAGNDEQSQADLTLADADGFWSARPIVSTTSSATSLARPEPFRDRPTLGPATRTNTQTIGYDAATEAQLWAIRYQGPASANSSPISLGVSPTVRRESPA